MVISMVYVTVFLITLFLLFILFYIYKTYGFRALFDNPLVLSCYFFMLIHLFLPLMQWHEGFFRYSNYNEYVYTFSIIYVFLLYLLFSFVFVAFPFNRLSLTEKFSLNLKNTKRYLVLNWLIFFVGFYFSVGYLFEILKTGLDVFLSDRLAFSDEGSGFKILLAHWVYIASILFFAGFMVTKYYKKLFLFSFLATFFYCFLYYGVNSNRNSIFILGVTILVLYFIFKRKSYPAKKGKKIFFSLAMIGFVFFFYFVGKIRNSLKGYNEDTYSFVTSLNGGFGNHENIVWLLSNDYSLLLGKSYLASLLNIIPRAFWADKPYGAGPELKNMIYPGSYILGQEGNSSLTTGFFTEALMNFGSLGSFVFVLFFSILLFFILNMVRAVNNFFSQLLYIYFFVLFASQFFYAEFLGFYTRTLITCIPLFILAFFINFERKV